MKCLHPFWLKKENFAVPCGRCLECKRQRRLTWANRLMAERMYHKYASFITLTYADEWLPPTLQFDDLQKFWKRLRKDLQGRKIKYYACGEYGDKTRRPHFHAIVFGLDFKGSDRELVKENWPYAHWSELEQTARGRKAIGDVTFGSAFYVAGYVNKKLIGSKAELEYAERGVVPPNVRMSKGLALQFALDNKELLTNSLTFAYGGYKAALPRYFRDKLNINADDMKLKHYMDMADKLHAQFVKHPWLKNLEQAERAANLEAYGSKYERDSAQREIDLAKKISLNSENEYDFYDIF